MRIRGKLFLFLFPALLLSGLTINYLTNQAVCTTLQGELAANVTAGTGRLVEAAAADFRKPREEKLLPFLYALTNDLNASKACFADAGGTVLAHTDITQKGKKLPGAYPEKFLSNEGGYEISGHGVPGFMDVYVPVTGRRAESPEELALLGAGRAVERLGTLVVTVPLKGIVETEKGIARKNAAILTVVYCGILLAVFLLATLGLRPISRLIAGTERIRLGDYDARIPASSGDEIGDLARSFNEMSATLSGTIVSKNYLDAILDNMLDILIVTDLNGVIRKTNRAAQAALGAGQKELEGLRILEFFPTAKPGTGSWHDLIRTTGEVRDFETVLVAGSGARVPVLASASFIKNNEGAPSGIVVLIRDITFRKKYEAEMARSNEDLQRFAFVASHDLQEPLRTISNYIQLLESKYRTVLGSEAETHVDFITSAVGRMRALVRDLLEYSKINAALKLREVDTDEALDYVLAVLQDSIAGAGAVIERGNLPVIRADRCHVESLFQNLVSNAVKFRDGAAPLVRVGAEPGAGGWIFHVKDNGVGIEEKHGAKLFKLFGRLHGKGVDGAGIGLASCKKIVEYYGGNIWFESRPGEGTSFFFSIPNQSSAASADGAR